MIDVGIGVAFIILAVAILKYVEKRNKATIPGEAEVRLMTRITEIERRLTDIQDVMITIDDKLSRGTPGGRP